MSGGLQRASIFLGIRATNRTLMLSPGRPMAGASHRLATIILYRSGGWGKVLDAAASLPQKSYRRVFPRPKLDRQRAVVYTCSIIDVQEVCSHTRFLL